jgi:hypothetical protein
MSTLGLDRMVTVGRTQANILVEHQDIAPLHCRVEPDGDGWRVQVGGTAALVVEGVLRLPV